MNETRMVAPVLFDELNAANGKLGHITLNAPTSLNALTLEMVDLLSSRLDAWRDDPSIGAIFIDGAGDKAFCAGGDVQALYTSAIDTPGGPCEYAETFFAREYRMNYALHTYPKPIICWGHGIVMGGGLGIMAGCSHRIVTEKTRIAMPEITIGLFPDVGGSWFLNHMPGRAGAFLALTGASINAADALFTGIADRFVDANAKDDVFEQLKSLSWRQGALQNHALVRHALRPFAAQSAKNMPAAQVEPQMHTINALCDGDDIHQIIDNIVGQSTDDPWLAKGRDGLAHGSKFAARWIDRQLHKTRHCSLRETFQAELVLATNVVRNAEFAEGVRALLIDKDRNPAWQFNTSREVPDAQLEQLFRAPWAHNPLADLD